MQVWNERAKRQYLYQMRFIAWALTLGGGFIDTYAFIERGGTLAAGQTGNIVLFGINLVQHNVGGMLAKVVTCIAFTCGVSIATIWGYYHKDNHWRNYALCPLILACLIVGCLPRTIPNVFTVPLLSFGLAIQNVAFDKIEGRGYNNIFSTGNLKQAVMQWTLYRIEHHDSQKQIGTDYIGLVACFALGAVCSALCDQWLGQYTIWVAAVYLCVIMAIYCRLIYLRAHN